MMMKFFGSWGQKPYLAWTFINVFILFHDNPRVNGQSFTFSQITLSRPMYSVGATLKASCNATYLASTSFVLDWRINNTVVGLYQITHNMVPQLANGSSYQYDVGFSTVTTTVNTFKVKLEIRNLKLNDDQTAISLTCTNCVQVSTLINVQGNIDSNSTLIKLPTNQATIATEFTGLIINSGDISSPSICAWTVNPGLIGGFQFYQPSFGGCKSSTTTTYSISCFESSGLVSSNLTFLTPLTSNVSVVMSCSPSPTYNLQVIVKDCTSPTPSNVPVNPPTGVYNTPAYFQCSQNSTLFYASGTTGNTATKCLASAEWENEKIVQCWSAPTATLIGNNTHYVGDKATFQCNVVGGFPLADRVEVYFNGQIQALNGNTWTSTALNSSNNGDIVECRAISNYTSIAEYSHLGRDKKTLTVYYGAESFTIDGDPNSNGCIWYIATPGPQSCNISFSLNPATYTTSLTKNGAIVMNDANQMQTSPPTFVFLQNKPTYSDNGVYTLKIKNDKFQVDFNFSITVINITATTEQPITNPPYIPLPNNLGVIIGAACGGVVLLILIVVLVYYFLRKQRNKTEKGTGNGQLATSHVHQEPVGLIDEGYAEITHPEQSAYQIIGGNSTVEPSTSNYENFRNNVSVVRDNAGYVELNALDPNLKAGTGGDNGGYETVMVKQDSKRGYENVSFAEKSGENTSPIERGDPSNPP